MEKNSTKNLILTLSIIGIVSALLLTFVYQWTTPYIQANQAETLRQAISEVLPGSEEVEEVEIEGEVFYEGFDVQGNRVGVAYQNSGGGYNGSIELMVGVDLDSEEIIRISIVNHQETPGLGARITDEEYKSNFSGKPFGDYTVVKTPPSETMEVQAIAGATISSSKTTRIVEEAVSIINNAYGGGS
ncbi:electron transport complex protein RnfG [Halanaerobium saccharolyticum]|uniref:Ion-translocating oxidoreductase complex subunit G n=1 Tax=Halanaerobium saccharolyticum TaxID=43595 RepID=A0A4R7Z753_9FIRM|nr:RnfABCDGE type electron transport complex subunit G [Halanaerobium saccharolyticum]RAK09373.1 electron transport complex protein RnfG [Halanaerobium saccharolyticum]TDW06232.1 electron transport complex protein RnfG [Halanaerobium saccharolyticum]TDX61026.1 electron transport complex protein RnfG [Halanaerobium saccharolyticum]